MKIFFLGWAAQYERHFIKYLAENYAVEHLAVPKGLARLQRITALLPARSSGANLLGRLYCRLKKFGSADLLICNEAKLDSKINSEIVKTFPGQKVLLIRDLVDRRFLDEWRQHFDAIYSFDQEQCAKLGIDYLNQFIPIGFRQLASSYTLKEAKSEPTALFIGREKGRGSMLLSLAEALKKCGCKIDFRILTDESTTNKTPYHITSKVDYYTSLEETRRADVLVEINQPGQSGFTLRTLEAAFYGRKLITDNQAIKTTPLYHPHNVLVLGDAETWATDAFREFLHLPFQPVERELLYKYSPDFMLESLMMSHSATPSLKGAERKSHVWAHH